MLTYPDIMGLEQESCNWKEVCLPEENILKFGWKEKYFHSLRKKVFPGRLLGPSENKIHIYPLGYLTVICLNETF